MMAAAPEVVAATTMTGDPELTQIQQLCEGLVQRMTEGQQQYIHMPGLHFRVKGNATVMEALLCLNYPNPSYPTKLYLPTKLGLGLNWNDSPSILGKVWHSWSWKDVRPTQSPFAILAGHLEAFK